MGTASKTPLGIGSVKYKNREYVTQAQLAIRLGVTKSALSQITKSGVLTRQKLEGYSGLWYDWEISKAAFVRHRKNPKRGGSREKPSAKVFNSVPKTGELQTPPMPVVSENIEIDNLEIPKDAKDILSVFDPESPENADCWVVDEAGEFLMIPTSDPPRHYIDWKKAIDKCIAQIRYQQYMEKKGDLIPKQEVNKVLSQIFSPLTASIMQIPDRYASRIVGRVDEMLESRTLDFIDTLSPNLRENVGDSLKQFLSKNMTNEENTVLKDILLVEAEKLCHNLQDAVTQALENSNE